MTTPESRQSETPWTLETMAAINALTPDIKGKAFNPDWFLLRQRFESIERQRDELLMKLGEVNAGCDLQRGNKLYRQVLVVIGPGKTQVEIDRDELAAELERLKAESDKALGELSRTNARLSRDVEELKRDQLSAEIAMRKVGVPSYFEDGNGGDDLSFNEQVGILCRSQEALAAENAALNAEVNGLQGTFQSWQEDSAKLAACFPGVAWERCSDFIPLIQSLRARQKGETK